MLCAVLRQGFGCAKPARRGRWVATTVMERQLEPLLPGFICVSAAMQRVADQIQHLQNNDLTVLITGESGTGKDLVARAPPGRFAAAACSCPTTAPARRASWPTASCSAIVAAALRAPSRISPASSARLSGARCSWTRSATCHSTFSPSCCGFLEQGEVLPVGETRPQKVVRVVAATNADLEQRVSEGKFREDLFYRLSVIRIHVRPLRERREEIRISAPSSCAKPRSGWASLVRLSPETLDFSTAFPGRAVRQLRNEIQRAVALAPSGGVIAPGMLSPALSGAAEGDSRCPVAGAGARRWRPRWRSWKGMIEQALDRAGGNISATARVLGLTRRGLYLKMERLGVAGAKQAF